VGRESRELVPSRPVLDTISLLKPILGAKFYPVSAGRRLCCASKDGVLKKEVDDADNEILYGPIRA
jgi:hypothetical protein